MQIRKAEKVFISYPKDIIGLYLGAGHDGFRRAEIAYSIGNLSSSFKREDIGDAVSILKALTMKSERVYTQILALNSLGIIGKRRLSVFDDLAYYLRRDLDEPSCYPIGALAFLEKAIETFKRDETIQMLDEAAEHAMILLMNATVQIFVIIILLVKIFIGLIMTIKNVGKNNSVVLICIMDCGLLTAKHYVKKLWV